MHILERFSAWPFVGLPGADRRDLARQRGDALAKLKCEHNVAATPNKGGDTLNLSNFYFI